MLVSVFVSLGRSLLLQTHLGLELMEFKTISVHASSSSSLKYFSLSPCQLTMWDNEREKKKKKAHNHLQCLSAHLQTPL